jgi:putative oxidoreductase
MAAESPGSVIPTFLAELSRRGCAELFSCALTAGAVIADEAGKDGGVDDHLPRPGYLNPGNAGLNHVNGGVYSPADGDPEAYRGPMTTSRGMLARLRLASRMLTGSTYVLRDSTRSGSQAVAPIRPLRCWLRKRVPLPDDDELVVRGNAAVMVASRAMLSLGILPRLSALALAGSLIPTTIAGHSYWAVEDPGARKLQRIQFHKNMAMIGGLLLAVLDEP